MRVLIKLAKSWLRSRHKAGKSNLPRTTATGGASGGGQGENLDTNHRVFLRERESETSAMVPPGSPLLHQTKKLMLPPTI